MSFVVRVIIIAVNDPHGIIELKPVLKSKTTSRITLEHPLLFHPDTDPGRDLHCLSWCDGDRIWSEKVIPCRAFGRALWQHQLFIRLFSIPTYQNPFCPFQELLFTYFLKSCDSLHHRSPSSAFFYKFFINFIILFRPRKVK